MKLLAATLIIIIMAELAYPSPTQTSAGSVTGATVPATMTPTPVGTATRTPGIGEAVDDCGCVWMPIIGEETR